MSSRAERRRAERESNRPEHKSSGSRVDISAQLRSHILFCKSCQSKVFSGKPCRWLVKFYGRNQEIMDRLLPTDEADRMFEERVEASRRQSEAEEQINSMTEDEMGAIVQDAVDAVEVQHTEGDDSTME